MRVILFILAVVACFCYQAIAHGQEPVHNDLSVAVSASPSAPPTIAIATAAPPFNAQQIVLLLSPFLGLLSLAIKRKMPFEHWIHKTWVIGLSSVVAGALGTAAAIVAAQGLNWFALATGLMAFFTNLLAMAHSKPAPEDTEEKAPPAARPAGLNAVLVLIAAGCAAGFLDGCAGGWSQFQTDVPIVVADTGAVAGSCGAKVLNDLVAGIAAGAAGIAVDVINAIEDGYCIYVAIGAVSAANGGALTQAQRAAAARAITAFGVVKAKRAALRALWRGCEPGYLCANGDYGIGDVSLLAYPGIVRPIGQ